MSEQQHQPIHDSLEDAIEAFERMSVPDRPLDAVVLAQLDTELNHKARPSRISASSQRGRYLLRFLVPSAAAVLVLGLIGLLLLSDSTSKALAEVVNAAKKHKLVRHHQEEIRGADAEDVPLHSTIYADFTAPRFYSETRISGANGGSVRLSIHDGKHHLTTDSREKTAKLDLAPKGYKSLLCCLEEFQQKKGVTQARANLDGQTTVKYTHTDGKQRTILWGDATTKLPLRLEQQLLDASPGVPQSMLIWTEFAWDPQLPQGVANLDELFSTRPPAGYSLDDRTKK
jgi:hypothetical protein